MSFSDCVNPLASSSARPEPKSEALSILSDVLSLLYGPSSFCTERRTLWTLVSECPTTSGMESPLLELVSTDIGTLGEDTCWQIIPLINCYLSSQFMMFISESTTLGMRTTHQYIIIIYYDIQYLDFLSLTRGWNPWSCSQLYTHIMNKLTFLFYVNKYITTYRESEMESNWMWYWGVFYQYSRKSILVDLGTTTGSRMTNNSINSICYWV